MSDGDELLAGRYRRLSRIGRGGMGEVWLAADELLERRVAIKRLFGGRDVPDPVSLERMMREARLAARLDHPNAVTIHDVVLADAHPHLIMQYVAGSTLGERIADGALPLSDAARVVGAVAAALAEAHAIGIVHRDVKPANVLIDERGRALLADFGIARSSSDAKLTQTGLFIGTPGYLAPELARGEEATPASDVYALGATLYTAVEGAAPFDDGSPNTLALLHRILTQPVPPPVRAGELTPVVVAMLASDPAARPTAAAVAAELSAWTTPDETTRRIRHRVETAERPAPTVVRPSAAPLPPTVVRPSGPPGMTGQPADPAADPLGTLVGAIDYAAHLTDGWSGDIADWEDLIADEIAPNLRFDDQVDLFVPTLFAIDPDHRSGFPRRLVRALGVARAGATLALGDRVICAWNTGSWSARHFSLHLEYRKVQRVDEVEYSEGDFDYDALEVATDSYVWAILFSREVELRPLRDLLAGRLRGAVRPEWRDGHVERWLIQSGGSAPRTEPGWPDE